MERRSDASADHEEALFENEVRTVCKSATALIWREMSRARVHGKHGAYEWMEEDPDNHITKGARHALTATMKYWGWAADDKEDHLALGMVRLALAVAQRSQLRVSEPH